MVLYMVKPSYINLNTLWNNLMHILREKWSVKQYINSDRKKPFAALTKSEKTHRTYTNKQTL